MPTIYCIIVHVLATDPWVSRARDDLARPARPNRDGRGSDSWRWRLWQRTAETNRRGASVARFGATESAVTANKRPGRYGITEGRKGDSQRPAARLSTLGYFRPVVVPSCPFLSLQPRLRPMTVAVVSDPETVKFQRVRRHWRPCSEHILYIYNSTCANRRRHRRSSSTWR